MLCVCVVCGVCVCVCVFVFVCVCVWCVCVCVGGYDTYHVRAFLEVKYCMAAIQFIVTKVTVSETQESPPLLL